MQLAPDRVNEEIQGYETLETVAVVEYEEEDHQRGKTRCIGQIQQMSLEQISSRYTASIWRA